MNNATLTPEFIKKHIEKPWDWYWLSRNYESIDMEFIKALPNCPWNWTAVSSNFNLSLQFIIDNPDKPWDLNSIICNKFLTDKQEFIQYEYRRYLAAYRIQQWWHRLRLDPRHPVGQRRLEREYKALFSHSV